MNNKLSKEFILIDKIIDSFVVILNAISNDGFHKELHTEYKSVVNAAFTIPNYSITSLLPFITIIKKCIDKMESNIPAPVYYANVTGEIHLMKNTLIDLMYLLLNQKIN